MCSDKRMHRVLETLKPPVLSAAVKASLLQVFPPALLSSARALNTQGQASPGRHGLCQH